MAKIAIQTCKIPDSRELLVKGRSYADDDPRVAAHPDLFESADDAAERSRRPTSTADLPHRQVERATQAPGEKRDVDLTCAECGFEAKSPGGLGAHQRSHGDD